MSEETKPLFTFTIKSWPHLGIIFGVLTPIITTIFTGAVYLSTLKYKADLDRAILDKQIAITNITKEYETKLDICNKKHATQEFAVEVILLRYLAEYNKVISEWEDDKTNIALSNKVSKVQTKLAKFIYSSRQEIIKKEKELSKAEQQLIMSSAYIDLNGRRYLIPQNAFMILERMVNGR